MSSCPPRCSARSRARPRPSVSGARRSSTPTASSRPRRSSPTPPTSSAAPRQLSSQVRIDQLTGQRAVLAPGRAERPDAFAVDAEAPRANRGDCPFCEGREDRTPPEVYAVRPGGGESNSPGWTARVVPNLYPVLSGEGERESGRAPESGFASPADPLGAPTRAGEPDLFAASAANGAHEVIVNAPQHVASLAELDGERFAGAVEAWREVKCGRPRGVSSL